MLPRFTLSCHIGVGGSVGRRKCLHEDGVAHTALGESNFSYDVDSHHLFIYDSSDAVIKYTREGVEDKGFRRHARWIRRAFGGSSAPIYHYYCRHN